MSEPKPYQCPYCDHYKTWERFLLMQAEKEELEKRIATAEELLHLSKKLAGSNVHMGRSHILLQKCDIDYANALYEDISTFISYQARRFKPGGILNKLYDRLLSNSPNNYVTVRKDLLKRFIEYCDGLAILNATHFPCEPVPEIVEARDHLQNVLEKEKS